MHWKLKRPEQIDKFMQKMGISEAVADMPLLADLLEVFGKEMNQDNAELYEFIKKIGSFALRHAENNVYLLLISGLNLSAAGVCGDGLP